jgi:Helix-turn-helix domain
MKTEDGAVIHGRARIAHELGVSERTISRWARRGLLPARKAPFSNSVLRIRLADLERLRAKLAGEAECE